MDITHDQLKEIIQQSLQRFLESDTRNLQANVSEINLCARLAMFLQLVADEQGLEGYYADTEYNRKQEGAVKTMMGGDMQVIPIRCDLLLHSRGERILQDNLIAVEAKKRSQHENQIEKDRERLRILTNASYGDNTWSADGIAHPEHVCGYALGCMLVVDGENQSIEVEHFINGETAGSYALNF